MDTPEGSAITRLLRRMDAGDAAAASEVLPLVQRELESMARAFMRNQDRSHTLQPTALLNEAYLRLVDRSGAAWQSREHFFAVASRAMRSVLIDHERRKRAVRRERGKGEVPLDDVPVEFRTNLDLLALDEALEELSQIDEKGTRVIELMYFCGLSANDAAKVLGVSSRTVERHWRAARAWLYKRLGAPLEVDE